MKYLIGNQGGKPAYQPSDDCPESGGGVNPPPEDTDDYRQDERYSHLHYTAGVRQDGACSDQRDGNDCRDDGNEDNGKATDEKLPFLGAIGFRQ